MKLLFDANISWRLVAKLKNHFTDCFHVDHIGLIIPAKDTEVWSYAIENNCIIVTNDDDFLNLANTNGFPPKVVLLRTGNQSNGYIESLLIRHQKDIADLSDTLDYGFLEIF